MVRDEDVKKYMVMEAPDLRMRVIALDTENNILKAQLQSLREERNRLLRKVADIDLSSDRPVQSSGMSPVPKLVPRP